MNTLQFKTNLKCEGCISKVTPALNELKSIEHWSVDLKNPDRILLVSGESVAEKDVEEALQKNGYQAEKVV